MFLSAPNWIVSFPRISLFLVKMGDNANRLLAASAALRFHSSPLLRGVVHRFDTGAYLET